MRPSGLTQAIRAFDVLVLGPLLIYAGHRPSTLSTRVRSALMLFGATTILYNGARFMREAVD